MREQKDARRSFAQQRLDNRLVHSTSLAPCQHGFTQMDRARALQLSNPVNPVSLVSQQKSDLIEKGGARQCRKQACSCKHRQDIFYAHDPTCSTSSCFESSLLKQQSPNGQQLLSRYCIGARLNTARVSPRIVSNADFLSAMYMLAK